MERESLMLFVGIFVRLIKKSDGFCLYGRIAEIFEDSVLFETRTGQRLISFDEIGEITPVKDKYEYTTGGTRI